jgi:hypothetical protein
MHVANSRKALLLLLALLAGTALRLWFVHTYPQVEGDSLVYGDIAKNLIEHGIYGPTVSGVVQPTLIRLPGYPLFLAACFRLLGMDHYRAVLYVQVAVDLASCLLIAAFVRRISGERQAWIALFLAALCPFTANYTANAMAETLSVFCVALALYGMALLLQQPGPGAIALLAFAFSFAALLRPDGALLAIAFCPAIVIYGNRYGLPWDALSPRPAFRRSLQYGLLIGLLAILPFVPWTLRNWRTFHVFQPLAPRYATDPGEFTAPGLQRWMKTWCIDFSSTYEIYWNIDNAPLDIHKMPSRAFDSPEQFAATEYIFNEHNKDLSLTPELDARFQALADERVRGHLLRYYLWLPAARIANMWLRPRVEDLPIELRWWQYWLHHQESYRVFAYEALNLAYLAAALVGLYRWPPLAGAMVAYMLLRSLLLGTIEAPETRYTLECFPMIIALAAIAFSPRATSDSTYERPVYRAPF